MATTTISQAIPFFGARAFARQLALEVEKLKVERDTAQAKAQELTTIAQNLVADSKAIQAEHQKALRQLEAIGGLSIVEIDERRRVLQTEVDALKAQLVQERAEIEVAQRSLKVQTDEALRTIVETRETALLQEVGIYDYRHPLTDAVAYEKALDRLQDAIKAAAKKEDGGAILATTTWEVN